MAAIDYAGIRDGLKTILNADALTAASRVYVEEEPQFGMADAGGGVIAVFSDGRTPDPAGQPLANGKRTNYHVNHTLWVAMFNMESFKAAADARDALLANVELVLMKDRTIGGKVAASWLEGGQMFSARDGGTNTFVAAGEIKLVAQVSAINA